MIYTLSPDQIKRALHDDTISWEMSVSAKGKTTVQPLRFARDDFAYWGEERLVWSYDGKVLELIGDGLPSDLVLQVEGDGFAAVAEDYAVNISYAGCQDNHEVLLRQILANQDRLIELAKAADDTPDIQAAQDAFTAQIRALSSSLSRIDTDFETVRQVVTGGSATNFDAMLAEIRQIISNAVKEPDGITPQPEPQKFVTGAVVPALFGSASFIQDVLTIQGRTWASGGRSTNIAIEKPGEWFEWRSDGKAIVGVTPFPTAMESWRGTKYSFYHLSDKTAKPFADASFLDDALITLGEKVRLRIGDDQVLEWQTGQGDAFTTVYRSSRSIAGPLFFYAVPDNNARISGIRVNRVSTT